MTIKLLFFFLNQINPLSIYNDEILRPLASPLQ